MYHKCHSILAKLPDCIAVKLKLCILITCSTFHVQRDFDSSDYADCDSNSHSERLVHCLALCLFICHVHASIYINTCLSLCLSLPLFVWFSILMCWPGLGHVSCAGYLPCRSNSQWQWKAPCMWNWQKADGRVCRPQWHANINMTLRVSQTLRCWHLGAKVAKLFTQALKRTKPQAIPISLSLVEKNLISLMQVQRKLLCCCCSNCILLLFFYVNLFA